MQTEGQPQSGQQMRGQDGQAPDGNGQQGREDRQRQQRPKRCQIGNIVRQRYSPRAQGCRRHSQTGQGQPDQTAAPARLCRERHGKQQRHRREGRQEVVDPVSYTHLDVYKRQSPSDAREGEVMADILTEKGIKSIALTYSNSCLLYTSRCV